MSPFSFSICVDVSTKEIHQINDANHNFPCLSIRSSAWRGGKVEPHFSAHQRVAKLNKNLHGVKRFHILCCLILETGQRVCVRTKTIVPNAPHVLKCCHSNARFFLLKVASDVADICGCSPSTQLYIVC